jgi:hypothetical protein
MTVDRFIIWTACDSGSLLNATTDEVGRPGDLSQLLPPRSKVVSVVTLPIAPGDSAVCPEGFRLLIVYRQKVGQ